MKFETKTIHAGIEPDPSTGAIMTPIFQTSTYVQDAVGDHKGYEYARTQNPTRRVLEKNISALENGVDAVCFSSGMAAMDAILKLLEPGDEVVSSEDLYGGSYRLMDRIFKRYGIKIHYVDMRDLEEVASKINEQTRLLWIETPTNPMLNLADIEAISNLLNSHSAKVAVDNTFASPYLQNPLELGADLVLHSATKYLGGHSDVIHGAVVCKWEEDAEQLHFIQNSSGAVPGPMECFLVLRGIKTLHVRMDRACQNAGELAEFLKQHPVVDNVYYPGLKSHPQHELAVRQMKDFGAMISFDLKGNRYKDAVKLLEGTDYFSLAESLGGIESLIGHPAGMTHAAIPEKKRKSIGLTDSLIRLSIGIENIDDLCEDLVSALKTL